jgi:hypothetical protein
MRGASCRQLARAALAVAAIGCSSPQTAPHGLPASPRDVWRDVESPAGHFTVRAPAAAGRRLEREENDGIVQYELGFENGERSFEVVYSDISDVAPENTDAFLGALVDRIAVRSALPVVARRSLILDGGTAWELDFANRDGPYARWRYLVAGTRLYQLGVIGASDDPEAASAFFGSFRPTSASDVLALPEAGLEIQLPSDEWQLARRGRESSEHWVTRFVRGDAQIAVHVERVPPKTDLVKFSIYRDSQDDFTLDPRCAERRGPNGELCNFSHADGPLALHHAVGGLRHRVIGGRPFDAYVVHAVYFDRGITIVMEAPSAEFAGLDPTFRRTMRSLHANPLD